MDVNLKSSEEEIDKALNSLLDYSKEHNQTVHGYIVNYYSTLLLFKEQNESNRKILYWSRALAIATWALTAATILVVYLK